MGVTTIEILADDRALLRSGNATLLMEGEKARPYILMYRHMLGAHGHEAAANWLNGFTAGLAYAAADFDEQLRQRLRKKMD